LDLVRLNWTCTPSIFLRPFIIRSPRKDYLDHFHVNGPARWASHFGLLGRVEIVQDADLVLAVGHGPQELVVTNAAFHRRRRLEPFLPLAGARLLALLGRPTLLICPRRHPAFVGLLLDVAIPVNGHPPAYLHRDCILRAETTKQLLPIALDRVELQI